MSPAHAEQQAERRRRRSARAAGTAAAARGGPPASSRARRAPSGANSRRNAQHRRAPARAASRSGRRARAGRPGAGRTRRRWRCRSCRRRRAGPRTARARARRRRAPLAVGGDEVDRAQVVDGQPVAAHQVAEAAAERQPADADVADRPAGGGEPVALGREVELGPQHAAGRARDARRRVDGDAPSSARGRSSAPSSQTPWPTTECPPPRTVTGRSRSRAKRSARCDVVGAGAAGDQRGAAVDRAVPDRAGPVVALLAGPQQRAAEAGRAGVQMW